MAFAPEGTFTVVEQDRAIRAGRTGGKSRSSAKVKAAMRNGRKGGRLSTRTLIERILNRPVSPEEWKRVQKNVLSKILLGHQQIIPNYFECDWNYIPSKSWRGLPLHVRQSIRHLKAITKIFLPKVRIKPPKDYIVIRVEKHPSERRRWGQQRPNMPFVMTRPQKIPIGSIFNYAWFDRKFGMGVDLTVDDIVRNGEGKITEATAVALSKYLKFKYAKP